MKLTAIVKISEFDNTGLVHFELNDRISPEKCLPKIKMVIEKAFLSSLEGTWQGREFNLSTDEIDIVAILDGHVKPLWMSSDLSLLFTE